MPKACPYISPGMFDTGENLPSAMYGHPSGMFNTSRENMPKACPYIGPGMFDSRGKPAVRYVRTSFQDV